MSSRGNLDASDKGREENLLSGRSANPYLHLQEIALNYQLNYRLYPDELEGGICLDV
jgi:hypothetical protein